MHTLRYIFKNITILNILLFLTILSLANFIVLPLVDINLQYSLPTLKKTKKENTEVTTQPETPVISDYMLIAEQNLFHPERKIPEKTEEKQLPKPEFVLYGTLITDDSSIAYMEDMKAPYNTTGRGKRQKALQKGAVFSGFTLTEIHHDNVVMVKGEEKIDVKITDQQYKKARGSEITAPVAGVKSSPPPSPEVKNGGEQSSKSRAVVKSSPAATTDKQKQKEEKKSERETRRSRAIQQ